MTRFPALACLLFVASFVAAQPGPKPNPRPVWSYEGLEQPESAQYDPATGFIYVSNVAGEPGGKDGKGWITKLDARGKAVKKQWASGLDAPKGFKICGGKMYVADIDALVELSMSTGGFVSRLPLRDAKMLNGVAADAACNLYVADTLTTRVYRVSAKKEVSIVAEGPSLMSPNGLALDGASLVIASWGLTTNWATKTPGRLLRLDLAGKKVSAVPGPMGNLDGIQRWKGQWLVSDWVTGTVMRVAPNGLTSVFLHGFKGPADLGLAPGVLLVPRMGEGRLDAYAL